MTDKSAPNSRERQSAATTHEKPEPRASLSLSVLYRLGHTITETWETTDLYCPACGARRRVWVESAAGDYYEGPNHLCAACGAVFTMPRLYYASGPEDAQRLEAVRGL